MAKVLVNYSHCTLILNIKLDRVWVKIKIVEVSCKKKSQLLTIVKYIMLELN